jgi:hypothetical protein
MAERSITRLPLTYSVITFTLLCETITFPARLNAVVWFLEQMSYSDAHIRMAIRKDSAFSMALLGMAGILPVIGRKMVPNREMVPGIFPIPFK